MDQKGRQESVHLEPQDRAERTADAVEPVLASEALLVAEVVVALVALAVAAGTTLPQVFITVEEGILLATYSLPCKAVEMVRSAGMF
jgi:hypothetical protein